MMVYLNCFEKFDFKKVLIMENDSEVDENFVIEIRNITGSEPKIFTGVNLIARTERGFNSLMKEIAESSVIAFETEFAIPEQIEKFMKIFASLVDSKEIIVKTDPKNVSILEGNPLYSVVCSKHKIVFI